ncbi:MAG TPA: metallophosphoesterase [Kineosporiaceae bacterium]
MARTSTLFAISDLHVGHLENRAVLEGLRPDGDDDWLIVAGDVGEFTADIEWALGALAHRFRTVIWAPGNHELWTPPTDPVTLRGVRRYEYLVALCRRLGIHTPEDPFPVWSGPGGDAVVAPLFVLYDYSFLPDGLVGKEAALAYAHDRGVVCTDELLLHPDPFPSREAWCWDRLARTEQRLDEVPSDLPTVLVSHWPLVREPTRILWHPEFALWCGTTRTATWHRRYRACAAVYGHLHIPRTQVLDGVPFEEVSVGYPREWRQRGRPIQLRRILPRPV